MLHTQLNLISRWLWAKNEIKSICKLDHCIQLDKFRYCRTQFLNLIQDGSF